MEVKAGETDVTRMVKLTTMGDLTEACRMVSVFSSFDRYLTPEKY